MLDQRLRRFISALVSWPLNNFSHRPIIGGVLSNPATRWPDTLGRIHYLRHHPYFLPCAASGFIAFVTFIISFFGLKEVLIQSISGFSLFTRLSSDFTLACCSTKTTPTKWNRLRWCNYLRCYSQDLLDKSWRKTQLWCYRHNRATPVSIFK